jgi:hypothetical protein
VSCNSVKISCRDDAEAFGQQYWLYCSFQTYDLAWMADGIMSFSGITILPPETTVHANNNTNHRTTRS